MKVARAEVSARQGAAPPGRIRPDCGRPADGPALSGVIHTDWQLMQSAGVGVEDGGRNRCEVKNPSIRLLEPRSPALVVVGVGGGGWGWRRGGVAGANPSYCGATPWTSHQSIVGPRYRQKNIHMDTYALI